MTESLRRGIRSGIRLFRTSPVLAVAAVMAMGLGIGFTCTMFAIVRGATRPLPVADPHQLAIADKIRLRGVSRDLDARPFDYHAWASSQRSFQALAAFTTQSFNLSGEGVEPERVPGAAVTLNTLDVLGERPLLGRMFTRDDERNSHVMISHRLWQRRFGGDPAILGRTIRIDGRPCAIVGVMPPGFGFPVNAALWLPLELPEQAPGEGSRIRVFGRLQPGVAMESAGAELTRITQGQGSRAPATYQDLGVSVYPFTEMETPREVIRALYLMVLAASLVFVIACTNVASLFMARTAARKSDYAVRRAIGATRAHLVVEQIGETAVLSMLAALLGLAVATAGTRVFAAATAHIIEAFWVDFRVDPTVIAVATALSVAAAVLSSLGPMWRASAASAADGLKDRSGASQGVHASRMSRALIPVQVALACGLLAMTTLLAGRSLELRSLAWPFDPGRIVTMELAVDRGVLGDQARRDEWLARLEEKLAAVPGVASVGLASALPGNGSGAWSFSLDRAVEPGAGGMRNTGVTIVSPGYFDVLGAGALAGRLLDARDSHASEPVAVVNRSFVSRHSPDRDPLGRTVHLGRRSYRIVGVVPDLMAADIQDAQQDGIYLSNRQWPASVVRILARGGDRPMALVPELRAALASFDADLPVTEIFSLHEAVYRDKRVLDVLSLLFSVFGAGALSLTAVGLYGLISFAVTQRRREIGIRLALGATPRHVAALVLRGGIIQVGTGLAAGIALGLILSRAFASAVDALHRPDAQLLATVVVSVMITAAAAFAVPARRAVTTEVARSLRMD